MVVFLDGLLSVSEVVAVAATAGESHFLRHHAPDES